MISVLTDKDDATLLGMLDINEISNKWQNAPGVEVGSTFRNLATVKL